MSRLVEQHFRCPCCNENVSMVLDLSIDGQDYVEDCEVCCRPVRVTYQVRDDRVEAFTAHALDDA